MTAEVAVMNKTAVALAADSAVTVTSSGGKKIYKTVDKLFMLSECEPVGIMIYGNGELMGIPWETIIKMHTKKLKNSKFNTLREYAEQFIESLDNGNPLFPEEEQSSYIIGAIISIFAAMKEEINDEVDKVVEEEGEITKRRYQKITSTTITKYHSALKAAEKLDSLHENHTEEIIIKYQKEIQAAREYIFEKLPIKITENLDKKLTEIGGSLFSKDLFSPSLVSGIVIAGFGDNEIFPSLISYLVEGVANDRLKYKESGSNQINRENTGAIIPFAQKEMIYTFVQGVHPLYQAALDNYLDELFKDYPTHIVDSLEGLTEAEEKKLIKKLKKVGDKLLDTCKENMVDYGLENHIYPIINSVAVLPKEELAVVAESLINLSSWRKRVFMEDETVGEPIDVAVISKGDGFVWIKQKQYFDKTLNPHLNRQQEYLPTKQSE